MRNVFTFDAVVSSGHQASRLQPKLHHSNAKQILKLKLNLIGYFKAVDPQAFQLLRVTSSHVFPRPEP